jgi:hypothetical protein
MWIGPQVLVFSYVCLCGLLGLLQIVSGDGFVFKISGFDSLIHVAWRTVWTAYPTGLSVSEPCVVYGSPWSS